MNRYLFLTQFTRRLVSVAIVKRHAVHLAALLMDRSGVTGLDVNAVAEGRDVFEDGLVEGAGMDSLQ